MRSNSIRSASRAVSATASGCSAKRAAISAGGAITDEPLPRRWGSVWSSVESRRAATNASCRRARSGWWEWTLPVATHGTPEPLRPARQRAVARAVAAPERALQLDAEALAPERGEQARAVPLRRAVPARSRTGTRCPPRGARPPPASRAAACARADWPACARAPRSAAGRGSSSPCGPAASRVRCEPSSSVTSAPVIAFTPSPLQACANSIAPQMPSWSVSATAP